MEIQQQILKKVGVQDFFEVTSLQVLLLENTRFHKEEEKNDKEFAKKARIVLQISRLCTFNVVVTLIFIKRGSGQLCL